MAAKKRKLAPKKKLPRKQYDLSWHPVFLTHLAETANVWYACKKAKINRTTVYEHREKFKEFSELWDVALKDGVEALEFEALRRARFGVEEPVFYKGEICGQVKKYSDTLLIFLLKAHAPEKFRERYDVNHSGKIENTVKMYGVETPEADV